jgi:hypothetical protein
VRLTFVHTATSVAVITAAVTLAPPVRAQAADHGASAPSAADLNEAAMGHVRKGELAEARALYRRAYEVAPSSATLFNLALAELNSGWELAALKDLRSYLNDPAADPAKVAIITRDLLPRALRATGHLDVHEAPPKATFRVDDHEAERAEGILDVTPGVHTVSMEVNGEVVHAETSVRPGATAMVSFPARAPHSLPSTAAAAPNDRREPVATEVEASGSNHGARLPVSIALAGAGVASLVGALVFVARNHSAHDRWETLHLSIPSNGCASPTSENSGRCADLKSALDEQNSDYRTAATLYVVGGALMVGALVTYLVWPRGDAARSARVVPAVDPFTRSVVLRGTF